MVNTLDEILGGWRVVSGLLPTLFPQALKNTAVRFFILKILKN